MVERILVPIDGSECSDVAVRYALGLAHLASATVTFLHAYRPDVDAWVQEYDHRAAAEDVLSRAERTAKREGIEAGRLLVPSASPDAAIVNAAEEFDVIVMGSHGRRGFDRMVTGSVTEAVLRGTRRPLLVVNCASATEREAA